MQLDTEQLPTDSYKLFQSKKKGHVRYNSVETTPKIELIQPKKKQVENAIKITENDTLVPQIKGKSNQISGQGEIAKPKQMVKEPIKASKPKPILLDEGKKEVLSDYIDYTFTKPTKPKLLDKAIQLNMPPITKKRQKQKVAQPII